VPKRGLAPTVPGLLQAGRLKIATELPLAATLPNELTGFRVKINVKTGHDSYGASEDWRSAPHDDLVLALAMACWHSEAGNIRLIRLFECTRAGPDAAIPYSSFGCVRQAAA
jgi:hypothetical protein